MPPVVSYAGVVLAGATSYDWPIVAGIRPVQRVFSVTAKVAEVLQGQLGKAGAYEVIGPRATQRVEQITLLQILPGSDPFMRRIRLSDSRWRMQWRHVAVSMNVRRATGDKFLVGGNRLENKLIQPEIRYARYSLYPPDSPADVWIPRTALEWVVQEELGYSFRFDDEPEGVEIQGLVLDDPGHHALERVLAYLPGANVYLAPDDQMVYYDTRSGKERQVLEGVEGKAHTSGGSAVMVDNRAMRPSRVVVLFTPEIEMRFNARESGGTVTRDTPTLVNVAPTPDLSLEVSGETVARGSYRALTELFSAWGSFGIFNRAITLADLRKLALHQGFAGFEQAWGSNPNEPPDVVASRRASTTVQHWRRTYRIDEYWVQRLLAIRPYRASVVNWETGAFGPAEAYCDWTRRPSYKGFARTGDSNTDQGWANRGYADDLTDAVPAPVRVDVVDDQAGIISVTPLTGPQGLTQAMVLGYPTTDVLPSQIAGDVNRVGQELYARWDYVELESDYRLAVVLTVVPGSPNGLGRFHHVEIDPAELTPSSGGPAIGPSEGPVVYARVYPGVMTARFGWQDSEADAIKDAVRGESGVQVSTLPESLLLNPDLVRDVARAVALRIYDALLDRPLGIVSMDMDPGIHPVGTIDRVRHRMTGGATTTEISFSSVRRPASIWRYLDASTRRAIMHVLAAPVQE